MFDPRELDARTLAVAARVALARVQASHATWTRTELMRQIKVSLSADELGTDPHAAARLVNELTDRALAGELEPVQCLKCPTSWRWPTRCGQAATTPRLSRLARARRAS